MPIAYARPRKIDCFKKLDLAKLAARKSPSNNSSMPKLDKASQVLIGQKGEKAKDLNSVIAF